MDEKAILALLLHIAGDPQEHEEVRTAAVEALKRWKHAPAVVDFFSRVVRNGQEHPRVRAAAIRALAAA